MTMLTMNLPAPQPALNGVVVQSNSLIDAAYSLTIDEMRLVYIAMLKIDSKITLENGLVPEINVTTLEFREAFNIKSHTMYNRLNQLGDSLLVKPIITFEYDEEKKETVKRKRVWFTSVSYVDDQESKAINLRFSPELLPFLYALKDNFTKVDFTYLAELDSPFAMRLYQWLQKYRRMKKYNKGDGLVETEPFSLEEIKNRTGLSSKYPEYKIFKRDVLDPAIHKINRVTDISVTYKPVKKGKTIVAIIFAYVEEQGGVSSKPSRARLPTRPKVTVGSSAEGEWARRCIHIMESFRQALLEYDPNEKLPMPDLKKLLSYYEIVGDSHKASKVKAEIASRTAK